MSLFRAYLRLLIVVDFVMMRSTGGFPACRVSRHSGRDITPETIVASDQRSYEVTNQTPHRLLLVLYDIMESVWPMLALHFKTKQVPTLSKQSRQRSTQVAMDFDTNFSPAKCAASSKPQASVPAPAFSIPPSLLIQSSVERYGQVTSPRDLSPAELRRDSFLENSLPVEQLQNKPQWLNDRNVQALQNYQPRRLDPQQHSHRDSSDRVSKLCCTSKPAPIYRSPSPPRTSQQTDGPSPQPSKRKRGRPKSQPQGVEACTADGFPFQVSAARQIYLEKNRVAAHKCRMRKQEYIDGLEGREREYSNKNKLLRESVTLLREEVLELKSEVLRHAVCGFWPVEEYVAQRVDDLLGTKAAASMPGSTQPETIQSSMHI
jgi:hypothetical protein